MNIFDVTILDVWFCVYNVNDTNITSSCFDDTSSNVEVWYLYSTTSGTTDDGYMSNNDILNSNGTIKQFSFIIPTIVNTNANRFGVQVAIELGVSGVDRRRRRSSRRRVILQSTDDSGSGSGGVQNVIEQEYGSNKVTISDGTDGGNDSQSGISNLFGKNTILYYVIFALGAVLVAALIVICYLRNQQRKADMAINSIEFSTRNSREINNNNKNNNPDPQNENEGEDVIVTKNETIALEC